MNNLFMVISILGGLASLALIVVLLISLFAERLKPLRKKLTIALVTSIILCIVGGTMYEISPEDKARIAQEAEDKKVAEATAKKEAETKAQAEKEEKAKAKELAKKDAEEKKAQEEAKRKEEEEKRKSEKAEADRVKAETDRIKAEEKTKKEAEEEQAKAEEKAKKKAEEEEAKRLKAEKEAKAKAEQEQKAQAKKEKEEINKKDGTKVKIERYDTCNSQGKYCDRGGFHKGAFDTLQLGMNPEEVTLKLDRNAEEATIYYMKDKSGNYVELVNYYFEGAVYNVNAYFKDGKLYYAERNDKLHKPEERLMLVELE
ncbi:cell division protein MukB [Bacillus cereus]|uniref:cell division protein MukB n=1 Tax=Bacillus cereus TaxID=1396 RepID=UPI000BEE80C0|nr:cell division protein MukB [Bacillus cereus]PDZ37377.1 cell division protein MukB [Bacillus cereus]PET39155.1 cell division protein MukB [Bacillus cereus]PFA20088.1 cell division protein MukB [Bacillus cereus]PFS75530.1 cell division protein MukB [Bacillus cereus]PGP95713.1 cell division protein MukB [Bacillus cereus]